MRVKCDEVLRQSDSAVAMVPAQESIQQIPKPVLRQWKIDMLVAKNALRREYIKEVNRK